MYVNGEGVSRDNVLGYAWAAMAKEGGGGEAASGIVAQLESHLNAAARARGGVPSVSAGFEQIGIRRGYYQAPDGREDAIVLKLVLHAPL